MRKFVLLALVLEADFEELGVIFGASFPGHLLCHHFYQSPARQAQEQRAWVWGRNMAPLRN